MLTGFDFEILNETFALEHIANILNSKFSNLHDKFLEPVS